MTASRSQQPLVLVTGATGALGPCIVEGLREAGYRVRVFARHAPPQGLLPDNVDVYIGDIIDPEIVRSAMADCEFVIHMAALLHLVNPSPELRDQYEQINVNGTANVLDAARLANVRRVLFFGTIAIYGYSGGQILTEESIPQPDTFYGRTKLEGEKLVLAAKRGDGEPLGVVLRLGAVYGSRIKGNYRRLLLALARGSFVPIGSGHNRRTLVYDRDVAQAALLALAHPQANGRIYNVTDGRIHPLQEIIDTMCDALGQRPPRWRIPKIPVRIAATAVDGVGRHLLRRPLNLSTAIDKYTEDAAVDGFRLQHELGFVPQHDLATGWRETVAEMRNSGEL